MSFFEASFSENLAEKIKKERNIIILVKVYI